MRIGRLKVTNYRTLEDIELNFPNTYTAICGANDSGKTNVVRAIRLLMRSDDSNPFVFFRSSQDDASIQEDYPKWKTDDPSKREIKFDISLAIDRLTDAGPYSAILKQLGIEAGEDVLKVRVIASYGAERTRPAVVVQTCDKEYSGIDAEEVLKKLQSSRSILVHNSTQMLPNEMFGGQSVAGFVREITGPQGHLVASMKKTVDRTLSKISKSQQAEFQALLGRLETKYRVGLTLPSFDFGTMLFGIALGDTRMEVPLEDWGSGTRNRTHILLNLFRAKQASEAEASAGKITPVLVIEEPESFLHPSAQAEFSRVLQDLAEEFRVQVITTTHSPYMLSMQNPGSNILLKRHTVYKQLKQTEQVLGTQEDWMAPFGQALGLEADEVKPWKQLVMNTANAILLVEGEIDKEYFEMLRAPEHGNNQLKFSGEIVAYEGTGNLQNTILLRFVKDRFKKMFVTFDLDAIGQLEKRLESIKFQKGLQYSPVGLNVAGKKCVEGLLPDIVTKRVYGANPDLVQAATCGERESAESARNRLKKLLLEEFKNSAKPGNEYYGNFYPLVKMINKVLG